MKKYLVGFAAFMIVLFAMPLGHAAMIIMEKTLPGNQLYVGALLLGILGIAFTVWGCYVKKDGTATFLGLVGSLFVWTGWIEFCYVYYANRYGVPPLIENGEVVTKPEYLIMPSFVVTFLEMNILLWTSYLVLLFVYDNRLLGDRHPVTVFIAFASLVWSAWLFLRLLKIQQIGYAIRYAIPVVIIFWTFVEILGRWNLFKEIWVHPGEYKIEMLIMLGVFILFGIILFTANKWKMKKNKIAV